MHYTTLIAIMYMKSAHLPGLCTNIVHNKYATASHFIPQFGIMLEATFLEIEAWVWQRSPSPLVDHIQETLVGSLQGQEHHGHLL